MTYGKMEKRGCFFIKPNFLRLVRVNEKMRSNFHISILEKGERMNEELLTRLVEALEGINNNLGEMKVTLDIMQMYVDGFAKVGREGMSIGVTGDITTY